MVGAGWDAGEDNTEDERACSRVARERGGFAAEGVGEPNEMVHEVEAEAEEDEVAVEEEVAADEAGVGDGRTEKGLVDAEGGGMNEGMENGSGGGEAVGAGGAEEGARDESGRVFLVKGVEKAGASWSSECPPPRCNSPPEDPMFRRKETPVGFTEESIEKRLGRVRGEEEEVGGGCEGGADLGGDERSLSEEDPAGLVRIKWNATTTR